MDLCWSIALSFDMKFIAQNAEQGIDLVCQVFLCPLSFDLLKAQKENDENEKP